MECLRGRNGEMIVKELAICSDNCLQTYCFRPPYEETRWNRRENKWIEDNLNGYRWYDGDVSYYKLMTVVRLAARMFTNIYTKGLEKFKILEKILGSSSSRLFNLEDFNAPKHKDIVCPVARCQFHQYKFMSGKNLVCSVEKSMKFVGWIKGQQQLQKEQYKEEEDQQQQKEHNE